MKKPDSIKSESSLWSYIKDGMSGLWDATRHEDRLSGGTPDISYGITVDAGKIFECHTNGWVELKWLREPVVDVLEPISIPHFTYNQKRFLRNRGKAGGSCWLLIGIEAVGMANATYPVFMLIKWNQVNDAMGDTYSYDDLYYCCTKLWANGIDFEELAKILGGE